MLDVAFATSSSCILYRWISGDLSSPNYISGLMLQDTSSRNTCAELPLCNSEMRANHLTPLDTAELATGVAEVWHHQPGSPLEGTSCAGLCCGAAAASHPAEREPFLQRHLRASPCTRRLAVPQLLRHRAGKLVGRARARCAKGSSAPKHIQSANHGTTWQTPQTGRCTLQWMCFDACPLPACLPYAAERMAAVTPDAKLIFMLRDPAAGVFSSEIMVRFLLFRTQMIGSLPLARLRDMRALSTVAAQYGLPSGVVPGRGAHL